MYVTFERRDVTLSGGLYRICAANYVRICTYFSDIVRTNITNVSLAKKQNENHKKLN